MIRALVLDFDGLILDTETAVYESWRRAWEHVVPLFAFVNAGVSLQGMTPAQLFGPVPLGIALGLVLGKQIGVFGMCWLGIKLGIARLPANVNWSQLYGVAILTGIGFTMSLFIGSLAFEAGEFRHLAATRVGVLGGLLLSAVAGYMVLRRALARGGAAIRAGAA